jgi:hypothetical protein
MSNPITGKQLWEILVPASDGRGNRLLINHHRIWDEKVRKLTGGGMTISAPAKGEWVNGKEGSAILREPMIPVRLLTDRITIDKVATMTMEHYDQKAVLYYMVSDTVYMLEKE